MSAPSPSAEDPSPTSPPVPLEHAHDNDDDASSSDSEEEEPQLKYERITGDIAKVCRSDLVSAVCIGSKVIAIGSHNGKIYIFDLEGHELKRVRAHTASISDLSLDKTSEYLASSSIDGKVIVQGLEVKETQVMDFKRPVRSVALDPDYGRSSSRRVVSGGMAGHLILNEKGWLGNSETTLHSGEGPIYTISWRGPYIAWANDTGVKIWHIPSQQQITSIDRSADAPRADLNKCRLIWKDDTTVIIGWDDCVTTVILKQDPSKKHPHGEIQQFFQMDSIIAGLLPYPPNILVLCYTSLTPPSTPSGSDVDFHRRIATRPELRIISPEQEELSSDALSLKDHARLQSNDYSLHWNKKAKCVYIVSPSDIVVGRERTAEDRVQWLLERGKYREALEVFESSAEGEGHVLGKWNRKEIGVKYIEHLIEEDKWEDAGERIPGIFGLDAVLWEKNIFLFAERGHLKDIAPYVPTKDIVLPSLVYEMILGYYIDTSPPLFLKTIHTWPSEIYSPPSIISAVQTKLRSNPSDRNLLESLAELYIITSQPREVVKLYVQLNKPETFEFIRRFRLFEVVKDDVSRFLHLRTPESEGMGEGEPNPEGIKLLIDHSHTITPEMVIGQLEREPYFQYQYIRALREREGGFLEDWGDLQVELYAEFQRDELLQFLKTSNTYNLEKARVICEKKNYTQELVFIFSRMGDNKRALTLIIDKLEDVEMAVDFVRRIGDEELWNDLVEQAKSKPGIPVLGRELTIAFIKGLLEHAGSILDPIRLVKSIPEGMQIEGLKESLIKIFYDHEIQMSLSIGVAKIFATDVSNLSKQLRAKQKRGVSFEISQNLCSVCKETISADTEDDFIAFFCGHIYHKACLLDPEAIEAINASRVKGVKKGGVADKVMEAALLKPYLGKGCEVCGTRDVNKVKGKGKGVTRGGQGIRGKDN